MKFTLSWLRDHLDTDATVQQRLTRTIKVVQQRGVLMTDMKSLMIGGLLVVVVVLGYLAHTFDLIGVIRSMHGGGPPSR